MNKNYIFIQNIHITRFHSLKTLLQRLLHLGVIVYELTKGVEITSLWVTQPHHHQRWKSHPTKKRHVFGSCHHKISQVYIKIT